MGSGIIGWNHVVRTVGFGVAANYVGVRVVARVRKPPNERLPEYLC